MVSYKNLYLELLKKHEEITSKINETDFYCPLCQEKGIDSLILENGSEYFCSLESCKFDKLTNDIFIHYAEMRDYKRVD